MKKVRKTIILTMLIMVALTAGIYYFLTRGGTVSDEFDSRIAQDQSDQTEGRAYLTTMEENAILLQLSGDGKNVLNFDSTNVYNRDVSTAARERLDRVIKKTSADFETPIIAANPFGTNLNSFYFYFTTDSQLMVRYTVTVADKSIPDHIRYVNNGQENNLSKTHEFTVSGLVPGRMNFIVIDLLDNNGNVNKSATYKYEAQGSPVSTRLTFQTGNSKDTVYNGMYFVFPAGAKEICAYDNSGILRNITRTESDHGKRIYQSGDCVLYQVSPYKVAKVSSIGRVMGTAEIKGYGKIIDFAYDGYDNVYTLVGKKSTDYLLATSLETGKTKTAYTFPAKLQAASVAMQGGGTAYIACAEPKGIIKIEALTSQAPRVALILGRKADWKKIPSKNDSWKKKVTKDTDPPNWDTSSSLLNLAADSSDGTNDTIGTYLFNKGKGNAIVFSVDGKNKSMTADHTFPVGQAGKCGCQMYEDHFLISYFDQGKFAEYDEKGKVTKEYSTGGAITSVQKLSLNGMCFYAGSR